MKITDQCKKEIIDYLNSKGFLENNDLFPVKYNGEVIRRSCLTHSPKGIEIKLYEKYIITKRYDDLDKYFLEFIGHVLRKHNITEMKIAGNDTYTSKTWEFNNIKKMDIYDWIMY